VGQQEKPIDLAAERLKRRQIFKRVRGYMNIDGFRFKIYDSAQDKPPPKDKK